MSAHKEIFWAAHGEIVYFTIKRFLHGDQRFFSTIFRKLKEGVNVIYSCQSLFYAAEK